MSDEQEQDSSPLVPIEQQTIMFYGKPLVVVRLPDGRPGIVLYAWAQSPKVIDPPATLVPAEQIIKPVPPADDAGLEVWREYHRQMVAWLDWQHDIETWRGSVESRLESLEEVTSLIPEILERLGPHMLTPEHQRGTKICPAHA